MDIKYVIACCTDMALGDSRKYPWPYMYTDGFSEFWGQGGVLWTGNPRALHWGLLTTGIPKAWGVLNLEFPQGKDESVFLENAYFIDLMTNWQTLLMAAEDKHPLISDVFIWYSFVEENQQKVGFTSSSRKTCCKTSFFLSWKQPHKLFCPFDAKHGSFDRGCHFKFQTPKAQIQDSRNKNIHTFKLSSECTNVHHKIF